MSTIDHGEEFATAFRKWYWAQKTRDGFYSGTEPAARHYGLREEIAALYRAHEIGFLDRKFALGISIGEERRRETTPNDAPSVTDGIG